MVHHGLQIANAARVLAVMGQPLLAELVRLALHHGRLVTRIAHRGDEAAAVMSEWHPHLAIVDVDIGQGELLDHLQTTPLGRIPIIALTQRGDLRTKLAAFEKGVDDILAVPFSPEELVARTLAVMRRTYREPLAFAPSIRVGDLEIDMLKRRVRVERAELHLTSLELNLLYLLAANAGRVLTREQIMDSLWGAEYLAESNVVDRHVRNLRAKLQNSWRQPRFIATVPGQGYRFLPQPQSRPEATNPASVGRAGIGRAISDLENRVNEEVSPDRRDAAMAYVGELHRAAGGAKANPARMSEIRDWFARNTPQLAAAVSEIVVSLLDGA